MPKKKCKIVANPNIEINIYINDIIYCVYVLLVLGLISA
jgi:hypothetical protein